MTGRPLIKICCMASPEEAELAARHGADMIGLVGPMPSGAGIIGLERAAEIAAAAPPQVECVLLTSSETAAAIIDDVKAVRPHAVQIVRHVARAVHAELRRALPALKLIQVVHVEGEASLATASDYSETADLLLLDSGRPSLETAELGGTGRVHDWAMSRRIVAVSRVPVLLAGGLNPANARAALTEVRPAGLDVCSGLRSGGALDGVRLAAFMAAAREYPSQNRPS